VSSAELQSLQVRSEGGVVVQVVALRPSERVVVDSSLIAGLTRRMGARGAEGFVTERVEEISDRLADIDWQIRHAQMVEVPAAARRVARLSGEIGLTSLARAAHDLADVARTGDPPAWAAVWDRVVRIGDRSLALVWDAPGLSM
jgi:phosphoenolpyruvate-protein kinase (PTS system EI component)